MSDGIFRLLGYFGGAGSLKSNKHHHSRAGGNLVWDSGGVCLFGYCCSRTKIPACAGITADGFGVGYKFQAALGKGSLKMGRPSERAVSDGLCVVGWVVNPAQNR